MEVIIKEGQTLMDIAVQEFGAWEAAVDIARLNNLSLTDTPTAGTALRLPDKTYHRIMERYVKSESVSPATLLPLYPPS